MNYQERPAPGIFARLYFLFFILPLTLLLVITPLGFMMDIFTTISSGWVPASSVGVPSSMVQAVLMTLLPTFFFARLRSLYWYFPWLLPVVIIGSLNLLIFAAGAGLLFKGFEVINASRQIIFIVLAIVQIIVSRLAMCAYFHFRPLKPLS
ncbi:hypothetical protein ACFSFZ_02655 [Mixta tenebrionis]|uniref:Uncharacterized protein n=1 Tax=Mixta tenebrionis TaxID=2562439 RepID=A0A506V120_9GAMM|nr:MULTISPECIES: hypothetical protein [Mixta]QHM77430.1 hypothetical protein C7M52_03429 [Mixta theicola]TPW39248.1 hypothetical protein FKM52_19215 [Mixta tenebrionis]